MLNQHAHQPGVFDAGQCWACARQAGLLDHYRRVQQETTLQEAHEWTRAARWYAIWSCARLVRDPADRMSRRPPGGATPAEPPARYEIRVKAVLDPRWSAWFEGLQVSSDEERGQTTIAGPVADQAALHGLLAKVRDLGLPLIWVRHINPNQ